MKVGKFQDASGATRVGVIQDSLVGLLPPEAGTLRELLGKRDLWVTLAAWHERVSEWLDAGTVTPLAPIDDQEVWAAGVTYKRSQKARMDESEDAANFYDKVYTADRPELFFKATAHRVSGPGQPIRVRQDTKWCVPEPELTLVISPDLRIVGYTVGNDMSARDIEGENPLYLPQAKVYDQCAGLGPIITLAEAMPPLAEIGITLVIERDGGEIFRGDTQASQLHRSPRDLVNWLGRDQSFPHGVFLMTGTGIVPPDHFTCQPGDVISITIDGVGTLSNPVVQG